MTQQQEEAELRLRQMGMSSIPESRTHMTNTQAPMGEVEKKRYEKISGQDKQTREILRSHQING